MTVILAYGDLIGLEYDPDGLDPSTGRLSCAGVGREILRRIGLDPSILPASTDDIEAEIKNPRVAERWRFLGLSPGLARRLGDTIVAMLPTGPHVHVVVQENPPRAISASIGHGVYTIRPSMISCPMGVWRPVR